MRKTAISLKHLYDSYDGKLRHGEVLRSTDGEWEYYDLENEHGTVYMDGEVCEVVSCNEDGVTLKSIEEEDAFILTHEEFNVASFKRVYND